MEPDDDTIAPCGECTHGMREVTEVWARQEAGIPRGTDLVALEQSALAEQKAYQAASELVARGAKNQDGTPMVVPEIPTVELWAKYRAALNTVFPCPRCRPSQFRRWRHGCFRNGHVPARCTLCREASAA